ncbi:MAG: hypothetical protein LC663_05905, partial [Actinobacteria bacterium]|nr:hypothetical protein [Actinomycetota bacterium]
MTPRRIAQIALAVVAVAAAAGAAFRYLDRTGEFFGERLEVTPAIGPVGVRPIVQLRDFSGAKPVLVYLCVGATSDLSDCVKLGRTTPKQPLRSVAIPHEFPDGTPIAPASYVLRAGAEGQGLFPVRGSFRIIPFRVGHRPPAMIGFDTASPNSIKLINAKEIARGAACRPPVWLADGRLVVGSTILDVSNGVTVQFSVPAAEIAWSPVGDKLAYITTDRKELDLAGPDGSSAVAKVREARGLLSSLSWSPEGDRIAFIAQDDPNTYGGPGPPTVNILNATNGNRTQAGPGLSVAWSSQESLLAVERVNNNIEASTPDGARRPLT